MLVTTMLSTGDHMDDGEPHEQAPVEPVPEFSSLDGGPEHRQVVLPAGVVGEQAERLPT